MLVVPWRCSFLLQQFHRVLSRVCAPHWGQEVYMSRAIAGTGKNHRCAEPSAQDCLIVVASLLLLLGACCIVLGLRSFGLRLFGSGLFADSSTLLFATLMIRRGDALVVRYLLMVVHNKEETYPTYVCTYVE